MDAQLRRTNAIAGHIINSAEKNSSLSTESVAASTGKELVQVAVRNGVAVLTLNSPPVNALSAPLLAAIQKAYEAAVSDSNVKAIVLTGAKTFSGGADVTGFTSVNDKQMNESVQRVNDFFVKMENGPKPVVAAIDGFALGGGLELAMSTHARLCTPTTSLSLPELNLGIIPGYGGTQRLPRLVPVSKAVEMILKSAPVKAKEAEEIGLVDGVVPKNDLLQAAEAKALELAKAGSSHWKKSLSIEVDKESSLQVLDFALKQVAKVAKNVPHPKVALEAIREGLVNGPVKGLEKERNGIVGLMSSPTTRALVSFFLATKSTNKVPGVTDKGLKPNDVKVAAVIGGGTMGSGIATALILSGVTTYLKEINQKFLDAGVERVKGNVMGRVKKGKMTEEQMAKVMTLLKPTLSYDGWKEVNIVIEAALEDIPLKQKIFAELEGVTSSNCILASNTSTINIEQIGEKTKSADRIVGLHFFSPAHVMPLLEIIRTPKSSAQVLVDTLGLAAKLRKTPVVVGNCVGFTANRIFAPYSQAAAFLVDRGVDVYRIDKAIESFGMPMGPFKMSDLSGVDIGVYVGNIIGGAYPDRVYKSTLTQNMVKGGRLGQKTKAGFYKYEGRKAVPDQAALDPILAESRKAAGNPPALDISDEEIVQMLMYPIANEGSRVLEEGHVNQSSDIDVCGVMGYGYPAYRGGPMKFAELEGYNKVAGKLNEWHQKFKHPLFKPSNHLLKLAGKK
eukprot:TRINITY_DN629_c0_g1_i1.p1 TRINITY_DN629_c0_g1~~TRINITY_DN629_c0_g1_i1.p1  ORF type:complete len:733 (-),score=325.51 TRINITY_DN629_c0_g1_i1:217-2415(-)